MVSDRKAVGAVVRHPGRNRKARLEKEKNFARNAVSLKTDLRRRHRGLVGRAVNAAVDHGAELHTVAAVKDHAVDRGGIEGRAHAVQHHASDGDLPEQRLALALCADDARKPVERILIVIVFSVSQIIFLAEERNASRPVVPRKRNAHYLCRRADGKIHSSVTHHNSGRKRIKRAAVGVHHVASVAHQHGKTFVRNACLAQRGIVGDARIGERLGEATQGYVGRFMNEKAAAGDLLAVQSDRYTRVGAHALVRHGLGGKLRLFSRGGGRDRCQHKEGKTEKEP